MFQELSLWGGFLVVLSEGKLNAALSDSVCLKPLLLGREFE